ncbi:MAG: hypothetical protein K1X44_00875 [Alphaproteobacteria bacterium]|nr:hypothetical protein [Alphaproteobacteria bacterium]
MDNPKNNKIRTRLVIFFISFLILIILFFAITGWLFWSQQMHQQTQLSTSSPINSEQNNTLPLSTLENLNKKLDDIHQKIALSNLENNVPNSNPNQLNENNQQRTQDLNKVFDELKQQNDQWQNIKTRLDKIDDFLNITKINETLAIFEEKNRAISLILYSQTLRTFINKGVPFSTLFHKFNENKDPNISNFKEIIQSLEPWAEQGIPTFITLKKELLKLKTDYNQPPDITSDQSESSIKKIIESFKNLITIRPINTIHKSETLVPEHLIKILDYMEVGNWDLAMMELDTLSSSIESTSNLAEWIKKAKNYISAQIILQKMAIFELDLLTAQLSQGTL